MGSLDIVKATEVLPSQEEVTSELDRLESSGDTQMLNEVAARARACQEYETQRNAAERAIYFARIKVMAEARIGSIDLELHPRSAGSTLEFDGVQVDVNLRSTWRILGMALANGQLERAMKLAEDRRQGITTSGVACEVRQITNSFVLVEPLLRRYRELYEREGLFISEVQKRAGVTVRHVLTRPGKTPRVDKLSRHAALRVAAVLGVDPSELRPVARVPRRTSRPTIKPARKLTGGRLDETYSLIRRALQELDRAAPTRKWGADEAWGHLYAAEEIIGNALYRVPAKDER